MIAKGNLLLANDLVNSSSPTYFDIFEYDMSGSLVQTIDIYPPVRPDSQGHWDQISNGDVLIATKTSTNQTGDVYKLGMNEVFGSFIANADLPLNTRSCVALLVDQNDKIYYFAIASGSTTATLRRFNPDGSFDADFTITPDAPVAPYTRRLLDTAFESDGPTGAVSADGRYFYYQEFADYIDSSLSAYRPFRSYVMQLDLLSNTHAELVHYDFTGTLVSFPPRDEVWNGISSIDAIAVDPISGDVLISANLNNQHTDPAVHSGEIIGNPDNYNRPYIDRVAPDGTPVTTYQVWSTMPSWHDDSATWDGTPSGTTNTTYSGQPSSFHVADGKLWFVFPNDGTVSPHVANTSIGTVDLTSGTITEFPLATLDNEFGFPILFLARGGNPGLALYPAAANAPATWGPEFSI